jgi:type IV pilus assembly protein PilA
MYSPLSQSARDADTERDDPFGISRRMIGVWKRTDRFRDQRGFSLVELMVVVMIIAILIGIAVPVFIGLQRRAQDRAAQTSLRDGFTAARAFQTDEDSYAGFDAAEGEDIEHTLDWADGAANVIHQINIEAATADELILTAMSSSGQIFCMGDSSTAATGAVRGIGDAATYAACVALPDW